jgi:hypothetical protein
MTDDNLCSSPPTIALKALRYDSTSSAIADSEATRGTGNGHFICSIAEEKELFESVGSRAIGLFHGVSSQNMGAARYKQHVCFGKLGGDRAKGEYSPFKYPLPMARPGATFDRQTRGLSEPCFEAFSTIPRWVISGITPCNGLSPSRS